MREEENVELVKRLFEAVGIGDVPSVRDMLAEDIAWQSPVTRSEHKGLTWCRPRRGADEVMNFFKELSEKGIIEPFENMTYVAQGDKVVVEGKNQGTSRSTGRKYEHEWVMIFTIHSGKIGECRHYYDTADIESAFIEETVG